ncbi:MAG TPA: TIR domain-containing protein, partial [Isosphaeraceae bacterium]|nr:TIR domain-containing protein [Isosphaeraceae bacterium]
MSLDIQESPRRDESSDSAAVDLFLSYNSRDRAAVQQVRTLLGARGISAFIDCEDLRAGFVWFEPLERVLGRVRGVVVLLGPNGLGHWQRREMALALERQTREATFPVIPVLLPASEAGEYSGFLLLNPYADLRGGLEDRDSLTAIVQAVRGSSAAGEPPPDLLRATAAICPYRGLNAFREEDAPLFFGRDWLVDGPEQGFLHKVLTCPLVAVVGASGSGKSSVVQAGLLPRLRREPPSRGTWDVVTFRPGKSPFLNLAIALEAARNPEASDAARETDAAALVKAWLSGDLPLELSLGRAREALRVDRLLVVVDQFEELITLTPKEDRRSFLSRLLAATRAGSGSMVLLTLRADYYGRAIGLDRGLCDGIQRGLINVGAMTPDERRAAIEGPARRVGLEFDSDLVDRLLDDVGDEPGNLPLLEFALTVLWERREGRRLINTAYKALGRVAGAIDHRVEDIFVKLTREQQAAAKRLFGRLVRVTDVDEEGRDTRQRVRLGDLDEASRSAVEPFGAGRLLVTAHVTGPSIVEVNPEDGSAPSAPDDPTTVEVAHEVLICKWDRLRGWIKEDRAFLLWRQRLEFQIAQWERSGRDEGMLLRGALLKEAEDFKSRWDDLNDRERDFLTWIQTDDYQIKIIEEEALNLVKFCEDPDARLRWLLALALTRGMKEALAHARVIEEPLARSQVLSAVAEALAKAGLADQAMNAALQAKDAALAIKDPWERSGALSAVAGALAKAGLADQAMDAALAIEDPWAQSQALSAVAEALAKAGLADQAMNAALAIEEPSSRSQALRPVAEMLAKAGLAD